MSHVLPSKKCSFLPQSERFKFCRVRNHQHQVPKKPSHDVRGLVYPGALPQHQAALPDLRQLRDAFLVGAGHHQALVDARTQGHQEPQDANVPSGEGDIGQEGHGIEDLR